MLQADEVVRCGSTTLVPSATQRNLDASAIRCVNICGDSGAVPFKKPVRGSALTGWAIGYESASSAIMPMRVRSGSRLDVCEHRSNLAGLAEPPPGGSSFLLNWGEMPMLLRYRPDARACYASRNLYLDCDRRRSWARPEWSHRYLRGLVGTRLRCSGLASPHPVPTVVQQMPWLRA